MRDARCGRCRGVGHLPPIIAHTPALSAPGDNSRPYRRSRCSTSTFLRARRARARTHVQFLFLSIYDRSSSPRPADSNSNSKHIGGVEGVGPCTRTHCSLVSRSLLPSLSPRTHDTAFLAPSGTALLPLPVLYVLSARARAPVPPLSFFCWALISPRRLSRLYTARVSAASFVLYLQGSMLARPRALVTTMILTCPRVRTYPNLPL
ncbi:hypothetical protein HETIRDRAFT_379048 [Heterobasidion irregulare TC 32-1]|uniref:Uncharacterized protein n=1 Tax=Heterobasidion irregulare (strain TC 32-1) TaxID=747525 RepID=W4KH55_HETIT|nr:uncharacterized protein HETIRDRAFT_379048 [Heterobasidion irregulare TC 32-1]ETW85049.1 hypothetical protein HETIRDRAFT_379048 [Heterobasidion irregulare TC 32-1]